MGDKKQRIERKKSLNLFDNGANLFEISKDTKTNSNIQGSPIKPAVERTYSNDCGPRNAINVIKRFATKDQKDSGENDESYDEFLEQYIAASRDLCIPAKKHHQYLHNLFRGESLWLYNAYAVGRAADFPEALRIVKEQLNLLSKQQHVKAELSKLSYATFVKNVDGNKRKALRNLQSRIEKRIPLKKNDENIVSWIRS